MWAAGAKPETIAEAQRLRAAADIQRLRLLASRDKAAIQLDALEVKVLGYAEAHASSTRLASAGNPAIADVRREDEEAPVPTFGEAPAPRGRVAG